MQLGRQDAPAGDHRRHTGLQLGQHDAPAGDHGRTSGKKSKLSTSTHFLQILKDLDFLSAEKGKKSKSAFQPPRWILSVRKGN